MRLVMGFLCVAACGVDAGKDVDLHDALAARGFAIGDGSAFAFGIDDCAHLPDCFESDETGSYLLFALPPAPGGTLPAPEPGAIDVHPPLPGESVTWQLGANEAVLIAGRMPPAARYFSVAPYLFDRQAGATRTTVLASVADATNNASMGDGAFDTDGAFLIVADRGVEARAREALAGAGWAPDAIHTIVMSPELVHVGVDAAADTVTAVGRVALFDDPNAGAAYLTDVPLQVLRLTAPGDAADPFPAPPRLLRVSATDERALAPAVTALGQAIETSLGSAPHAELAIADYPTTTAQTTPRSCIGTLASCRGDTSDSVYATVPLDGAHMLSDDPHDYFIVYGVNHEAAGLATYSNVVVTSSAWPAALASVESPYMAGGADRYLPDHPDRDKLFAFKVSRACGYEPGCLEVGSGFLGLPLDASYAFLFRAYLAPGSTVSPDPAALLTEHVIHVLPPPP